MAGANYGTDRPDFLAFSTILGALLILSALASAGLLPLGVVGAVLLLFTLAFFCDSHYLKPIRTSRMLDNLQWRGGETVLDIGCGRGLFLVNAAKHAKSGVAYGVDIWRSRLQTGNSPVSTLDNARLEGVADRVGVAAGDARALPFHEDSFDVIFASLVLHHIGSSGGRRVAFGEIDRVLKPGGLLVVVDSYLREYKGVLTKFGYSHVTQRSWGPLSLLGTRVLTANKPTTAEA